ncbi:hypothetical protein MTO96_031198 [Rhipicephalus appendiculatus]
MMSRPCTSSGTCGLAAAGDRGREHEIASVEVGGRRRSGMRSIVLLVAKLTAIVAVASEAVVIKDGSAASSTFREERVSAAKLEPWHDDDAGSVSRRRQHGSAVFDQIIVETLELPKRHRPSLAFILVVFVTGLFIGAIALLLCVLCLLKALSGRYWPVSQKDDTFCVVEDHGRLLANITFQQQQANLPAEAPLATKQCDVAQSSRNGAKSVRSVTYTTRNDQHSARQTPLQRAHDGPEYKPPTVDCWEPHYSRDMQQHTRGGSNWNRATFKSSGNVQHRQELRSDDEDIDGHKSARGLSNLRLDFRINEKSGRKNGSGGGGFRQQPPESSFVVFLFEHRECEHQSSIYIAAASLLPQPGKETSRRPWKQEFAHGYPDAQSERS